VQEIPGVGADLEAVIGGSLCSSIYLEPRRLKSLSTPRYLDELSLRGLPHDTSGMAGNKRPPILFENIQIRLHDDTKVKLAGVDVDGILRGKLVSKDKFLSIAENGFGFCSVVFGWDMHDQTYFKELKISNAENGYHDLIAVPDLSSFRRIPWENNVPFFMVSFFDPDTRRPVSACPRGLLKTALQKVKANGFSALAGGK
jgi:glutamine synthetase